MRLLIAVYSLLGLSIFSIVTHAYVIRGISAGVNPTTGERPARRDLREFQTSGPAFDLYIQALDRFQKTDQTDLLSWYEIAGIHGYPYRSWDNVEGQFETGYCSHGSPIFLPWHRPYIALYEEQVWKHAQDIAASYPDDVRGVYQEAATTLRVPYWDWALDPSMPESLVAEKITITTPSGQETIDNPLYTYRFHPLPVGTDIPSDQPLVIYQETVRSPDPDTGRSRMDNVQSLLQNNAAWMRSITYQLLSAETNYTVLTTSVLEDRGENYANLESLHDGVHALTGDGGHMSYFSMAAFDPIFMIHHCSIDRVFALWQALNPDSYVEPMADTYGTFVIEAGTIEDVNTPLYPFRSDDSGGFWTSASSRSTRDFGYTYPEIVDWDVDATTLRDRVRAAVNNLYNAPARIAKTKSTIHSSLAAGTVSGRMTMSTFDAVGVNNLPKQWAINILVDKYALAGHPFQVHFFYGDLDPNIKPADYGYAEDLIGSYRTFTSPMIKSSFSKKPTLTAGQISLSPLLASAAARGTVDESLEPESVVPQLRQDLHWRITDHRGEEVNPQILVDRGQFQVRVVVRDVKPLGPGEEHLFPTYGPWTEYRDATAGKSGG